MKFYATINRQRLVEIEANTLEEAEEQMQQGLHALLLDGLNPDWKTRITVSAVKGEAPIMRYYVQRISEQLFSVRERQAYRDKTGPNDRIVHDDFTDRESAHYYANAMNDLQRQLDERYGRWTKHAV
jgi:hypothetical protein